MGAQITLREYTNQFRPEKTSWLLGNVGDKISLQLNLEVEISTTSSFSNSFQSNGTNKITQNTGDFGSNGFYIGTNVSWSGTNNGTPFSGTGVITVLSPTSMILGTITGTFPPNGSQYRSNRHGDGRSDDNAWIYFGFNCFKCND